MNPIPPVGGPATPMLTVVNRTGYPLQIAVAEAIRESRSALRVVAEEHRWVDRTSGVEGFADIVLEMDHDFFSAKILLLLECKRRKVDRGPMMFLVPDGQSETIESRVAFSEVGQDFTFWHSIFAGPRTPLAMFNVSDDSGTPDRREVERVGRELALAAPALALEATLGTGVRSGAVVFPVLVTNSQLLACRYDPENIELASGELSEAEFDEVPASTQRDCIGGLAAQLTFRSAALSRLVGGSRLHPLPGGVARPRGTGVSAVARVREWLGYSEVSLESKLLLPDHDNLALDGGTPAREVH